MNDDSKVRSFRDLLAWQTGLELEMASADQIELFIARIHELQKMLHSLRKQTSH